MIVSWWLCVSEVVSWLVVLRSNIPFKSSVSFNIVSMGHVNIGWTGQVDQRTNKANSVISTVWME